MNFPNDSLDSHFQERVRHSKDFFARMESRVNLQSLGSFIRDGGTRLQFFDQPLQERQNDAYQELKKQVLALVKDGQTAEQIQSAVDEYEFAVADVYFSLGAKTGARLNALLMGDFDKDY